MFSMNLKNVTDWLDRELDIDSFKKLDASLNGLQISAVHEEVSLVAFAVDACKESLERAAALGADMLFVHHGLFWGAPIAITDIHYDRVSCALKNDLALYAAHLPLDAHPVFGNNAAMAERLKLQDIEPFGLYHGVEIGYAGRLAEPMTLQEIRSILGFSIDSTMLSFGNAQEISTVAIVSGGAASSVSEAIDKSIDLYITGEALHQVYHQCQESRINFLAGGHYATEVFGPVALASHMKKELGIETRFIDIPTGL